MNWAHCVIDAPAESAEATKSFWAAALGWPVGEPWKNHPEFVSLMPSCGEPYVHVQVIGTGPERVHVDLAVGDMHSEVTRLVGLGATHAHRNNDRQVMASPGGLPFCLVREPASVVRPPPTRWPDGHVSRLFQICIDSPEHEHLREVAFWPVATGWPLRSSDRPEFAGNCAPSDGPVRLILQRLGSGDRASETRAHIDLAADDVPAEVGRLMTLGATLIGPGDGWVTLRTPTGMPFCVAAQSPY